jgi:RES domain
VDIWSACKDRVAPGVISGELLRIVESQEQVATNALVDTLFEQDILERLLEHTKPPLPSNSGSLHYLLSTPFRYPPLPYGSRFGSRWEPSLLYGSQTLPTLFAEAAYYRFVFWQGMSTPPPTLKLLTQHTVFTARYHTAHGLQLQLAPFTEFTEDLIDPMRYTITQQLGSAMREAGVEAFEYLSARDPARGVNVALFSPAALASSEPAQQRSCLCETKADTVSFYANDPMLYHQFPLETFLINGKFPHPAV